jgi:hypothetical protein
VEQEAGFISSQNKDHRKWTSGEFWRELFQAAQVISDMSQLWQVLDKFCVYLFSPQSISATPLSRFHPSGDCLRGGAEEPVKLWHPQKVYFCLV